MKLFYSPTNPRIGQVVYIGLLEDWEEAQHIVNGKVLNQYQMRPDGLYDWYSRLNKYLPHSSCKLKWKRSAKQNPHHYIKVTII